MADYILMLLALCATFVGVLGDTWDKTQSGLKRIRFSGWAALAIGSLAAVISAQQTYKKNVLDDASKVYPYSLLEQAISPLDDVIELIYSDVHGGNYFKDFTLEMVLAPAALEKIDGINLQKPPDKVWSTEMRSNYAEYLCDAVQKSNKNLDYTFERYGQFVDKETFLFVTSLRRTSIFKFFETTNCRLFDPANQEGKGTLHILLKMPLLKKGEVSELVDATVALKQHLTNALERANKPI